MAENDKEILSCARKIRNYCKKHSCDDCVFLQDIFCLLTDFDGAPSDWSIPKTKKASEEDGKI